MFSDSFRGYRPSIQAAALGLSAIAIGDIIDLRSAIAVLGIGLFIGAIWGDRRYAELKAEIAALKADRALKPLPVLNQAPERG